MAQRQVLRKETKRQVLQKEAKRQVLQKEAKRQVPHSNGGRTVAKGQLPHSNGGEKIQLELVLALKLDSAAIQPVSESRCPLTSLS